MSRTCLRTSRGPSCGSNRPSSTFRCTRSARPPCRCSMPTAPCARVCATPAVCAVVTVIGTPHSRRATGSQRQALILDCAHSRQRKLDRLEIEWCQYEYTRWVTVGLELRHALAKRLQHRRAVSVRLNAGRSRDVGDRHCLDSPEHVEGDQVDGASGRGSGVACRRAPIRRDTWCFLSCRQICLLNPAETERSVPSTENRPEEKTRHKGVIVASQNVEIAKKAYDAFAAGDLDTVLSTFDDNVEFVVPGNSTVSGTYRGKAEVTQFFREASGEVLHDNAQPFPRRRGCCGRPRPNHRWRRIRARSRCIDLSRRQNGPTPELLGHCHVRTGLRHKVGQLLGADQAPYVEHAQVI